MRLVDILLVEDNPDHVSKPVKFEEFIDKIKGIGIYWGMINSNI